MITTISFAIILPVLLAHLLSTTFGFLGVEGDYPPDGQGAPPQTDPYGGG